MNQTYARSIAAAALTVVVLAAAGALADGNFGFAPPQGWTRMRSGTERKWVNPSGAEMVKLFPTTYAGGLDSFVLRTLAQERATYPTQHVWVNRNYMICGGHTGRFVIWTSSNRGRRQVWEQMLALWGADGYIVTYMRPDKDRPDNIARGSLLSICGAGTAAEQPGGVRVAPQNAAPSNNQPLPLPAPIGQPTPNPTGTIYHPYMPVIPN